MPKKKKEHRMAYRAFEKKQHMTSDTVKKKRFLYLLLSEDNWWRELGMEQRFAISKDLISFADEIKREYEQEWGHTRYFVQQTNNHVEFCLNGEDNDRKRLIYHYTSVDSFIKILESKSLRLMNSDYTNDDSEVSYFSDRVFEDREDESGTISFPYELVSEYKENVAHPIYLASFSRLEDDVSQWERYADDAQGVRIAFDGFKLVSFLKGWIKCRDILYGVEPHNIKGFSEDLREVVEGLRKDKGKVFVSIFEEGSWYKHRSFESEKEVRMIAIENKWKREGLKPKYTVVNGGKELREYLELKLGF